MIPCQDLDKLQKVQMISMLVIPIQGIIRKLLFVTSVFVFFGKTTFFSNFGPMLKISRSSTCTR